MEAQAKARGVSVRFIVVKHPVGGLNSIELQDRIEQGVQSFLDHQRATGSNS